jgi:hypothetical protein
MAEASSAIAVLMIVCKSVFLAFVPNHFNYSAVYLKRTFQRNINLKRACIGEDVEGFKS